MARPTEDFPLDPFSKPMPLQSLTDEPGKHPYEKPPLVTSPEQAFDIVKDSLQNTTAQETVVSLLDAGISSETIASSLVLKMFAEGVFTPDVAEIIKPPIVAVITDIGSEAGIEEVNVVNKAPQEGMTQFDSLELMEKTNPEKYSQRINPVLESEAERDLAEQIEFPEEEEAPQRESFLDMGVA